MPVGTPIAQQDEATRSRVHTTLLPFLTLRHPAPDSIRFITAFARRTGDLEVLSKPDIHLLALCYELELERNGGDWRLRKDPGQKGLNGKPPAKPPVMTDNKIVTEASLSPESTKASHTSDEPAVDPQSTGGAEPIESKLEQLDLQESSSLDSGDLVPPSQENDAPDAPGLVEGSDDVVEEEDDDDNDDDGDGGWITPSNLKKHQAKEASSPQSSEDTEQKMEAALLTTDFAMQNVALRVNLKYVSHEPSTIF